MQREPSAKCKREKAVVATQYRISRLTVIVGIHADVHHIGFTSHQSDLEIELPNGPALLIEDLKVVCRLRIERTRRNETLCGNVS